jgi:putative intracellular protease/amidase
MGLTESLPFLVQDELVRLGGLYSKGLDGISYTVRDGALITGQNRDSAADAANAVLEILRRSE